MLRPTFQIGQSNIEVALLLVMVVVVALVILPIVGVQLDVILCRIVGVLGVNLGEGCTLGSRVVFNDEFAKNTGLWDYLAGMFQLCDGRLCNATSAEHRAMAKGTQGTDYTVSVDAQLDKGNGYGIFFRASEGKNFNGYSFQYDPGYGGGQFIMRKWVNGTEIWPPFAAATPPSNYQWRGTERHVDVLVKGDTFTAKVDGQVVLVGKDASYANGQAGLRVWTGGQASFDNFKVTMP